MGIWLNRDDRRPIDRGSRGGRPRAGRCGSRCRVGALLAQRRGRTATISWSCTRHNGWPTSPNVWILPKQIGFRPHRPSLPEAAHTSCRYSLSRNRTVLTSSIVRGSATYVANTEAEVANGGGGRSGRWSTRSRMGMRARNRRNSPTAIIGPAWTSQGRLPAIQWQVSSLYNRFWRRIS